MGMGRVRYKRVWVWVRGGYNQTRTRTRHVPVPDLFKKNWTKKNGYDGAKCYFNPLICIMYPNQL